MDQKEACVEVKKMLEEIDKSAPRFIELHKDLDSLDNLDEIGALFLRLKKTFQDNSELRFKLKEWERRSKSIQRIDEIAEKLEKGGDNTNLSIDELHALYKQEMRGFNSSSPPSSFAFSYYVYGKTKGLRKKRQEERKVKEDYARIYGCKPEQITSKPDDVFKENSNTVVFIGVRLDFTNQELPKTLKHVSGNLQSDSKNAKLPKKLEYVGGHLELRSLESAKGLVLPETVGGTLWLYSLTSAKGLEKLNYAGIMGNIWLPETFSDQDKEEVEKIKIEQAKKGINVNFMY